MRVDAQDADLSASRCGMGSVSLRAWETCAAVDAIVVAEECVVRAFDLNQRQRARLLNRARELARTGRHQDHKSIVTQLEAVEGFAEATKQIELIRFQIDRLCSMARQTG